jgi:HK97 family phage portal protein
MDIIKRLFGGRAKSYSLTSLAKAIGSSSAFSDSTLMQQYGKSVYVYACVDKIAKYTATIDLSLHEIINSKGDTRELEVHPALDLLYKFNPVQTRSEFLRTTIINKKLTGKAYWYKVRNDRGDVVELWNLRPDLVVVNKDADGMVINYSISLNGGATKSIPADDIISLRDPNPLDIFDGMSPIQPARSRIETEHNASEYQKNFFLNNARPDAFLKTQDNLSDEQAGQIYDAWEERHGGKGKNSKIGILEGGMEYQQVSLSQREMDYIESMKFTRDDILVAFGVPKSVVTTDDVNRANAEAGMMMFIAQTIKPEMQQIIEVLNEFLLIPDFAENLYLDFKDPTPQDRTQQLAEFTQGVDKWITRNEIRTELGLPPIKGGDELFGSFTSMPLGSVQEVQPADNPKVFRGRRFLQDKMKFIEGMANGLKKTSKKKAEPVKLKTKRKLKSFYPADKKMIYADVVMKLLSRKEKRFKTAMALEMDRQEKRVLAELQKADIGKSLHEKISDDHINHILNKTTEDKLVADFTLPFITEFLKSSGQDALNLVGDGGEFKLTLDIQKKLEKRAQFFANSINDTTFKALAKSLSDGIAEGEGINQLSDRVKETYNQYPTYRLDLIARTESTYANNEGFLDAYQQSDLVQGKEWIATIDDHTREEHLDLNGEIVELNQSFSNGLQYPQEYNCRCVIAPAMFE